MSFLGYRVHKRTYTAYPKPATRWSDARQRVVSITVAKRRETLLYIDKVAAVTNTHLFILTDNDGVFRMRRDSQNISRYVFQHGTINADIVRYLDRCERRKQRKEARLSWLEAIEDEGDGWEGLGQYGRYHRPSKTIRLENY